MDIKLQPLQTAAGVGLAVVADKVYSAFNLPNNQVVPGIPLEHTHVGLLSLIVAEKKPRLASVATGFGVGLIVEDAVPGPQPGNWFGLYNPTDPNATKFVMGLYAVELGALVLLGSRPSKKRS